MRMPLAAAAAGALAATMLTGAPANADPAPYVVVASQLNNPRLLSFTESGDLYVAEAGLGGPSADGFCLPNPEAPSTDVCAGSTGSITKLSATGQQSRVVTGLPSLAGEGGGGAIGPADVTFNGPEQYFVTIGLGQNPEARAALGPNGASFGTIVKGTLASGRWSTQADLAAYEQSANPDESPAPDSNPVGFVRGTSALTAVDAGGNDLLMVGLNGKVSTVATFPQTMVANPFAPPGVKMPMDAVPTSVAVGPDGAYYVSQLTGFPFPAGGSSIWRVVPGETPTVWASGLTNVTDLAWDGSTLYAVQLTDGGLLEGPPGSLVKVAAHSTAPQIVVAGLMFPYGVAIKDGAAYVTVGSTSPGDGAAVKIPLG